MKLPSRPCIVCGRPIARRSETVHLAPSEGWTPGMHQGIPADIKTREECRRFTNAPYIVSLKKNDEGWIYEFQKWDGESFMSSYFCTNRCAMDQGYAAAKHGHRYVWRTE